MRAIFWVFGVLAVAAGIILFLASQKDPNAFWASWVGGGTLVIAGLSYCAAGARDYRGHWSFALGLAFLAIAAVFVGMILDGQLVKTPGDKLFGVCFVGFIVLSGVLSLWSGHKLHRCLGQLEGWA